MVSPVSPRYYPFKPIHWDLQLSGPAFSWCFSTALVGPGNQSVPYHWMVHFPGDSHVLPYLMLGTIVFGIGSVDNRIGGKMWVLQKMCQVLQTTAKIVFFFESYCLCVFKPAVGFIDKSWESLLRDWMGITLWIIIWLVVWNTFYFSFHIWDVILPIDELHHFSRWLF